jgi:iron complex outermembrane receptor protein
MGWNFELGFKGNWLKKKMYTEVAFHSNFNLLVAGALLTINL